MSEWVLFYGGLMIGISLGMFIGIIVHKPRK